MNDKNQLLEGLYRVVEELRRLNEQVLQDWEEVDSDRDDIIVPIAEQIETNQTNQQENEPSANREPPHPSKKMQALRLLSCGIFGKQTQHNQNNTEEAAPITITPNHFKK